MQQINQYTAENGMLVISRIICIGMLAGLSVTDLKSRRISGSVLILGSILAAVYLALAGREHLWAAMGGLAVGLVFVLVSRVTGEQLGYGDSWLLCILGVYLGVWNLLEVLCISWIGVAAAAAAVLMLRRYRRGTTLPLVPFLAAGYAVMWAEEILLLH